MSTLSSQFTKVHLQKEHAFNQQNANATFKMAPFLLSLISLFV